MPCARLTGRAGHGDNMRRRHAPGDCWRQAISSVGDGSCSVPGIQGPNAQAAVSEWGLIAPVEKLNDLQVRTDLRVVVTSAVFGAGMDQSAGKVLLVEELPRLRRPTPRPSAPMIVPC